MRAGGMCATADPLLHLTLPLPSMLNTRETFINQVRSVKAVCAEFHHCPLQLPSHFIIFCTFFQSTSNSATQCSPSAYTSLKLARSNRASSHAATLGPVTAVPTSLSIASAAFLPSSAVAPATEAMRASQAAAWRSASETWFPPRKVALASAERCVSRKASVLARLAQAALDFVVNSVESPLPWYRARSVPFSCVARAHGEESQCRSGRMQTKPYSRMTCLNLFLEEDGQAGVVVASLLLVPQKGVLNLPPG